MDYNTLVASETTVGSLKYAINWSRIDSAGIVAEAEAWIFAKIRVRQMVTESDVAIASGATSAAFPTGYLDPLHLSIPGYVNRLRLLDVERFRSSLAWDQSAELPDGLPTYWADIDGEMQFNAAADQAYTAKFVYFKKPTALGTGNTTNWLTDRYPTLLRRTCLMFAAEARKEYEIMDREEARALQMIEEIKQESDLGLRGFEADFGWEEN
jgi:hypothetical protein